jgi:hypothetical protein
MVVARISRLLCLANSGPSANADWCRFCKIYIRISNSKQGGMLKAAKRVGSELNPFLVPW